jgi:Mechanosensitive ion channel/Conserved TM helix
MFAYAFHTPLLADASSATDATRQAFTDNVTRVGQAVEASFGQVIELIPSLVAMLVVLGVGFVVARLVARTVSTLGARLGLQHAAERSGLIESMQNVGIQSSLPAIVGQIIFWLLMCVFLMAAFNILNLPSVSATMQTLVAYIPKLLAATVVIVIGLLIASFLRGVIATGADRVGLSYADRLATGCYYVLALMTFIAAFEQLEIKFALLEQVILIAFGAFAAGLGLALGLGGRDVVGGILAGYYVRQRLHAGDSVRVAGLEGTVRDVGPVATVIETDEQGMQGRHTVPNIQMLNEAVR